MCPSKCGKNGYGFRLYIQIYHVLSKYLIYEINWGRYICKKKVFSFIFKYKNKLNIATSHWDTNWVGVYILYENYRVMFYLFYFFVFIKWELFVLVSTCIYCFILLPFCCNKDILGVMLKL